MLSKIIEHKSANNNKTFLEEIELFIEKLKQKENFQDIFINGLKVMIKFPNATSASLFILNNDTYDFDFRSAYPSSAKMASIEIFSKLVESGHISKSLEKGYLSFIDINDDFEEKAQYVIVPLISTEGLIGMVIMVLNKIKNNPSKLIYDQLYIFTQLLASSIANVKLIQTLTRTQELLEQKVAQRTFGIAQRRRELQMILDSVQAAILVIDLETQKVTNVNPMASFIIGESQESIVGKNINSFFLNEKADSIINEEKQFSTRNFESIVKNTNNELIPILRTTSKIKLGNQKLRIESFFDITERKKFEDELKKANELLELKVEERTEDLQILVHNLKKEIFEREKAELEVRKMLSREQELNELKSRFLSMISHEFRTPLTIISTSSQILEGYYDKLNEREKKEYLNRILKTVDIMKDLLENVLFLGKSDSNMLTYDPKPINLDEFCRTLIDDFGLSLIKKRQVNFVSLFDHPIKILDPKLLRHILLNLLSNAVKYSTDDKEINFSVNTDTSKTMFIIQDYGIGIPEDEIDNIFDLFHRARNVGSVSGTGLGMAIVMKSLELHGGKIEIASKIDQGTTIKVIIPHTDTIN
jgi:PAS domain S-box-containing protein